MILDIHTHRQAPAPEAVISVSPDRFSPSDGQLYSIGIHPWNASEDTLESLRQLDSLAPSPSIALIGETGIDLTHPGAAPLFRQMLLLRHHIELSETLSKPLLLHDVKAHDIIIGLRKELQPRQPWIIHGFRAKPSVADMFMRFNPPGEAPGFLLSFGTKFNPDTLRAIPERYILAETDDSGADIHTVIHALSEARGADLLPAVEANMLRLLGK